MESEPIRVYVACPWKRRPEAIAAGAVLTDAGFIVTSRWFNHPGDPNDSTGITAPDEQIQNQAFEDLADILAADFIVVLNLEKSEGKAVETGFALAHGLGLISVGPRLNIFQTLGVQVETLDEAIDILKSMEADGE